MKNWITTLFGLLSALGTSLSHVPGVVGTIATYTAVGSMALLGINAQDSSAK